MATTKKNEVGTEVMSLCTKCKVATAHTIASKVGEKVSKVRCRECGSTHRYLKPDAPRTASTRKVPKLTDEETWNQYIKNASTKKKITYTFSGIFKQNDLIDHGHFGLGVVTQLMTEKKMQVFFREGEKILIMHTHAPL